MKDCFKGNNLHIKQVFINVSMKCGNLRAFC
jgi:hypothetical protein